MSTAEHAAPPARNHPLALRMGVIAFLNGNITLACIWGSFSVLLSAVEARLGVGRELSTLAVPLLNLATALLAAVVGALATKVSLRLVMLAGAALSVAGYLLLAFTASYPLYLASFGLFLGPAMAIAVILSPTLVTRWFTVHRGRALGLVSTQLVITVMPFVTTWMLQSRGVAQTYGLLAAISAVSLVANLFIVDRPPGSETAAEPAAGHGHGAGAATGATAGVGALTMLQIARTPQFWAMTVAFMASAASSIILTSHMAPMAHGWGYSPTLAATLLSVQSTAGLAGTVLFGWISDRLGGARALALVVFDAALCWLLLLLHLPFVVTAGVIALIGLHGAGALPVMSAAVSEGFGQENFSRAYGLANLANLPISVACVPAAALVYARTGSYAGAMVGVAAFLILASFAVLTAARRLAKPARAADDQTTAAA